MDGKSHENGTESLNLSPNSNKSVHKSKTFTKEESDTEKKESTLKEDNSLAVDNSTEKSRTWVKEKDKSNLKQSEKPISQPISPQPATISNEALKVENKNPEVGVHSRPNSRSDNKQTDFRRSLVLSSTGLRARPIKTPTTAGDLESTSRNKSDITISPESGETNNNLVSEKNISPESVDNSKRANCDQIKETVVETNKEPVHDSNEKTGNNLRGEKESGKESHDKSKPLKATQKEKVNETNSASDLNVKEGPDNKKVFGPEESSYLKNKEKKTIADQSNTQTQDNSGVTVDKTKEDQSTSEKQKTDLNKQGESPSGVYYNKRNTPERDNTVLKESTHTKEPSAKDKNSVNDSTASDYIEESTRNQPAPDNSDYKGNVNSTSGSKLPESSLKNLEQNTKATEQIDKGTPSKSVEVVSKEYSNIATGGNLSKEHIPPIQGSEKQDKGENKTETTNITPEHPVISVTPPQDEHTKTAEQIIPSNPTTDSGNQLSSNTKDRVKSSGEDEKDTNFDTIREDYKESNTNEKDTGIQGDIPENSTATDINISKTSPYQKESINIKGSYSIDSTEPKNQKKGEAFYIDSGARDKSNKNKQKTPKRKENTPKATEYGVIEVENNRNLSNNTPKGIVIYQDKSDNSKLSSKQDHSENHMLSSRKPVTVIDRSVSPDRRKYPGHKHRDPITIPIRDNPRAVRGRGSLAKSPVRKGSEKNSNDSDQQLHLIGKKVTNSEGAKQRDSTAEVSKSGSSPFQKKETKQNDTYVRHSLDSLQNRTSTGTQTPVAITDFDILLYPGLVNSQDPFHLDLSVIDKQHFTSKQVKDTQANFYNPLLSDKYQAMASSNTTGATSPREAWPNGVTGSTSPRSKSRSGRPGELENMASDFMERLKYTEGENRSLATENNLLKGEKEELVKQLHEAKKEADQFRRKAYDANIDKGDALREVENEKEEIKLKYETEAAGLRKEKRNLEERIKLLETMRKKEENDKGNEYDKLETILQRLQSENDDLREELSKSRTDTLRALKDLDTARKEIVKVIKPSEELKSEIDRIQHELQDTRDQSLKTLRELDALKKIHDRTENENEKIRVQFSMLETDMDKIIREAKNAKADTAEKMAEIALLKEKIEGRNSQNRQIVDMVKEKETIIESLTREINDLKKSNGSLLKDLSVAHGDKMALQVVDSQFQDISNSHKKLLEENKRMRETIKLRSIDDNGKLHDRLNEANRNLEKAYKRVSLLEDWMDDIYNHDDSQLPTYRSEYRPSRLERPESAASSLPDLVIPEQNRRPHNFDNLVKRYTMKNLEGKRKYKKYGMLNY